MNMNDVKKFSFVIPCYNSSKTISFVIKEIIDFCCEKCDYEIICVDDCSSDNVFDVLIKEAETNKKIKVIRLAKNFGQHNATLCAFRYVTGDIIVTLDDDGQTNPKEVGKLLETLDDKTDIVIASYKEKKHSIFRNFGTVVNKYMACWLCDRPLDLKMTSFRVLKRYIVDELCNYRNPYTYIGGLILRVTKNIKNIEIEHRDRLHGKSGYSISKLFSLWINGFTAFSVKPLRIATIIGMLFSVFGFFMILFIIIKKIMNPSIIVGYSSLVCMLLFIGGIIMMMLGLIGEYIGRIYICINNSPQYVIKDRLNFDENCQ